MSNKSDRANEFINNANSIINPYTTFIGSVEDNSSVEQKEVKKPVKAPKNEVKKDNVKTETKKSKQTKDKFFTFKLDDDIYEYIKQIDTILIIDSLEQGKVNKMTKTDYVNSLIREDLKKRLKVKKDDDVKQAYKDYAKKYGL
jgi:hypothetical protein